MDLLMLQEWKIFAQDCLDTWKHAQVALSLIEECREEFFPLVENHIVTYVMPQYGENDVLSKMPKERAVIACECAIEKYIARKEKHVRAKVNAHERAMDCFKRAHYAQLKCKYMDKRAWTDEETTDAYEAFMDWREIK